MISTIQKLVWKRFKSLDPRLHQRKDHGQLAPAAPGKYFLLSSHWMILENCYTELSDDVWLPNPLMLTQIEYQSKLDNLSIYGITINHRNSRCVPLSSLMCLLQITNDIWPPTIDLLCCKRMLYPNQQLANSFQTKIWSKLDNLTPLCQFLAPNSDTLHSSFSGSVLSICVWVWVMVLKFGFESWFES